MAVYLVTYDIKTSNAAEYEPLWEAFKLADSVKCQLSTWLVASESDQEDVYDYFKQYISKDDKLMVVNVYDRPSWNVGFKGTEAFIDRYWPI